MGCCDLVFFASFVTQALPGFDPNRLSRASRNISQWELLSLGLVQLILLSRGLERIGGDFGLYIGYLIPLNLPIPTKFTSTEQGLIEITALEAACSIWICSNGRMAS